MTSETQSVQLDIQDVGPCKKTVRFTLPASQVDLKFTEKYDEVIKTVPIPGFRVGRAPLHLLEKRFGEAIANDVTAALVQDTFKKAIEDNEWQILGEAEFDVADDAAERNKDYTFGVTIELYPQIELGNYRGIEYDDPYEAPDADAVERALASQIRAMSKMENATAGEAATANSVVILRASMCVMEGEEEFEFYAKDDARVDLSEPAIGGIELPELCAAIAGKKVEERGELDFVIPDDYEVEEWRGQKANLAFEVERIMNLSQVATIDELARRAGAASVDEYKESVHQRLREMARKYANDKIEEAVVDALIASHPFDMPAGLVARVAHDMLHEGQDAGHHHHDHEDDPEYKEMLKRAERTLRAHFLLDEIAETELIFASEDDVNRFYESLARQLNMTPRMVQQVYDRGGDNRELRRQVRADKTKAFLREKGKARGA